MTLSEVNIWIDDSLRIIPLSLINLIGFFKVEYPKLEFNHEEINLNNLSKKKKNEVLIYLKHELLSLLEIIKKSSLFFI